MRLVAAFAAVAMIAAACGSSSDDDSAATTVPTTEAPASTTAAPSTATTTPATTTSTAAESTTTVAAPTGPTTTVAPEGAAELELLGDGPYGVGATTVILPAVNGRPLFIEIWFPLIAGTEAEPVSYTFVTGDSFVSTRAIKAPTDAVATDGPFPLIVYSHGSGGVRYIHSDYTETLASHGYIVVAPDHTGNTAVELALGTSDDGNVIAFNRVSDVRAVIDVMTDPNGRVDLAASVDADKVAITGHSFGGFTSYAAVSGYTNDIGSVSADDRIDAIIALAPAVGARDGAALLSDDDLGRIGVPSLVLVGTEDTSTPIEPNVERAWELTTSSPHHRVEMVAAAHQSYTDVCDYIAAFEAGQPVTEPVRELVESFGEAGCAEGQMPIDRVKELTNTFALRFLDSVFTGSEMIDPATTTAGPDVIHRVK